MTSLGATVNWGEPPRSSETAVKGDIVKDSGEYSGASKHESGAYPVSWRHSQWTMLESKYKLSGEDGKAAST